MCVGRGGHGLDQSLSNYRHLLLLGGSKPYCQGVCFSLGNIHVHVHVYLSRRLHAHKETYTYIHAQREYSRLYNNYAMPTIKHLTYYLHRQTTLCNGLH